MLSNLEIVIHAVVRTHILVCSYHRMFLKQQSKSLKRLNRGVARIFQRGVHRGNSPDCHVDLHAHIN